MANMPKGGRPRGTGNVLSYECKRSILSVYEALGGAEAMLAWAKNNEDKYYDILVRILPKEIDLDVKVQPEARVYPIAPNEHHQLPPPSEAVDSVH